MDAFDADVLVYAAVSGHRLGRRVVALFSAGAVATGIGSLLLLPELLTKPTREQAETELLALGSLLVRLDLRPVDQEIASLAVTLGASYNLRAADSVHLATAVAAGADRFITNNQKRFARRIAEVDVTYPADLPDPGK